MIYNHREINMKLKRHILLVEDDLFQRDFLSDELAEHDYMVMATGNGLEALDFLESVSMDAVITDIFMPGMDGLELIQHLRRRNPKLPIFALSGGMKDRCNAEDYLNVAKAFGANEVFAKPVEMAELIAKLAQHCQYSAGEPV